MTLMKIMGTDAAGIGDSTGLLAGITEKANFEPTNPDDGSWKIVKSDETTLTAKGLLRISIEAEDVEAIDFLWRDRGVKECFGRRNEYQISDSAEYFLDNLDRISSDGFMPNVEDVLRVRLPTTGINEYYFDMKIDRAELK